MRETKIIFPLFLLLTIFLWVPVNSSITVECGDCNDRFILPECVKLIDKGANHYEEQPLSPGQQCSSLGLEVPLMLFGCRQKEPAQCKLKTQMLPASTHVQVEKELDEFLKHFKSREVDGKKIEKWCTCRQKIIFQSNNLQRQDIEQNDQSRYLQEDELVAAKENSDKAGDKDDLFQIKNTQDEQQCQGGCIAFVVIFWVLVCTGIGISIYCCCKPRQTRTVVVRRPRQNQPPQPPLNIQPPPLQPVYPVNNPSPEQYQLGSERQLHNQTNPW